eukprot:scaffold2668_cov319-Prasinococcus_capsulatus_cf.AAC.15
MPSSHGTIRVALRRQTGTLPSTATACTTAVSRALTGALLVRSRRPKSLNCVLPPGASAACRTARRLVRGTGNSRCAPPNPASRSFTLLLLSD